MLFHFEETFHAAHRLHDHPGECANLHGHSYFVQIDLEIPDSHIFTTTSNRAIDFSDLKEILKAHIKAVDHSCWLSEESCAVLFGRQACQGTKLSVPGAEKIIVTGGEPTAEFMAKIICGWLQTDYAKLGQSRQVQIEVASVTVWETDEQGATYAPGE